MRGIKAYLLLAITVVLLGACETGGGKAYFKEKHANGKLKKKVEALNGKMTGKGWEYSTDGKTVVAEFTMLDGAYDGTYTSFYKGGKKHMEISYEVGKREGEAIWYHEDGKSIYEKCMFKQDKKNGLEEKYYQSGQLMSKRTFINGKPVNDLVEYNLDGSKINDYPELILVEKNTIAMDNMYKLHAKLSSRNRVKKVAYYIGELEKDGTFDVRGAESLYTKGREGEFAHYLGNGSDLMRDVNVVAVITTTNNNRKFINKRFRIAVSN